MSGVVLLWGEHRFLLREAAHEAFGDRRTEEVDGGEWEAGLTSDLATPSLFGEERGLLVSDAQDLPAEGIAEIGRYAAAASPDAMLVLAFAVGSRAKGPPKKLVTALGDSVEVGKVGVERKELPGWLIARAKKREIPANPKGANALIQTLGEDPQVLDQAIEQLATSHAEQGLTTDTVAEQFRGLGDRRIWDLTDSAFGGHLPAAMRTLTAMLSAGEEPLALLGGMASRLRDLIRVRALPPGTPLGEVARQAGLRFDWQAKRYVEQARRFEEEDLSDIHAQLVEADGILKQGGAGDVVLPQLVARIAGGQAPRRGVRAGSA
ncbi:MAG: DNA polymerase III subunit delta [Actinomycetota bacterium]